MYYSAHDESIDNYARENYSWAAWTKHQRPETQRGSSARASRKTFSAADLKTRRFKILLLVEVVALLLAIGFLWNAFSGSESSNIADNVKLYEPGSVGTSAAFASNTGASASEAQEERPVSTPKSEWRRGAVPFLFQTDEQWCNEPYAGGTVEVKACGPTCLTMVYIALTGKTDFTPASMAVFSDIEGHSVNGETAWTLMTEGASRLGLYSEELPGSVSSVNNALLSGRPVICSVRPGDFTDKGHFIVIAGVAEDGNWVVHDPNSAERSSRTWDPQRVIDQCLNIWAFSA